MTVLRACRASYFRPGDFPIHVMPHLPQSGARLHSHGFAELVVVVKGQGVHQTEREDYPIARGDVFVMAQDQAHGYRDTRNLVITNVLFVPEDLPLRLQDVGALPGYHALFTLEPRYRQRDRFQSHLRLSARQLSRISPMLDGLRSELVEQPPGYRFAATAQLMQIIVTLSRYYSQVETKAVRPLMRLAETISLLENNLSQPITLDEMAETAHMSRSTLLRAFRQSFGCSPVEYLIRLRIDRATQLLLKTALSITEIAHQTGFSDSNYFARQFRKIMGCSPRNYRKG